MVAVSAAGLALSFWLLRDAKRDLGLARPKVLWLVLAAAAIPVVLTASQYVGYRWALPTLLAEIAAGGKKAAQQNTGAYGRSLVEASEGTIVLWALVLTPVCEELMFRGVLWSTVQRLTGWLRGDAAQSLPSALIAESTLAKALKGAGRWFISGGIATIVTSALFAWLHHDQQGGAGMVRIVQTGTLALVLGLFRHHTKSILPGIVLHAGYNAMSLAKLRKWIVTPVGPKVEVLFKERPIKVPLPIPDWYWTLAKIGSGVIALWLLHALAPRRIRARASITIARSREDVFDYVIAPDTIAEVFHGHGPIPGATKAEMVSDGGMCKGATRRVYNSDGSVIDEDIVDLERPRLQSYRLKSGMRFPFTMLVRSAGGQWDLSEDGDRTRIDWTFTFDLTTPYVWPIAVGIKRDFGTAMRKALECMRDNLEDA